MKKFTWQRAERILREKFHLKAKRRKFIMFPYDEKTGNWRPEGLAFTMMTWNIGSVSKVMHLPIMLEYRAGVPEFKISYWLPEPGDKENVIKSLNPIDLIVKTEDEFIRGITKVLEETR